MKIKNLCWALLMTFLARLISTAFGIGYSPIGPGTMGALATVIIYWFSPELTTLQLVLFCIFITLLGVFTSSITEKEFQKRAGNNKVHDPGIIIIDEIAGMLVALIALPKTLPLVIAAFFLFRFFDIVKPFPIKKIEKLPTGWGIMFDDVAAGIFSNIVLQLIIVIFHLI